MAQYMVISGPVDHNGDRLEFLAKFDDDDNLVVIARSDRPCQAHTWWNASDELIEPAARMAWDGEEKRQTWWFADPTLPEAKFVIQRRQRRMDRQDADAARRYSLNPALWERLHPRRRSRRLRFSK